MITIVIIIFNYNQNIGYKDFLTIYNWSLTFNSKIIFISDFKIKNYKNILHHYILNNNEEFNDILENIKINHNFIFYYSGHANNNGIILPNESIYSFSLLKSKIINMNKNIINPHIFIIFDCCHAPSFFLPFKWNSNFEFINDCEFTKTKILLISSTNENEKTYWSNNGSIFSRILFSTLRYIYKENKSISFHYLIKIMNQQLYKLNIKVNLYSSHFIEPYLWSWICSNYFKFIEYSNKLIIQRFD